MLELRALRKSYGGVPALDGASLAAYPGRILGFLGPNGAGKTTAMRAVLGLVALDGGEVAWQGRPIGLPQRRRFGYLPEQRGLYPRMRVGEQLAWLGRLHGMTAAGARRAAAGWLERLGLADRAGARLEQLSHGNQQRVQLAAALLHDPEALVLDEPFSGLDPVAADALAEVIRHRAEAGTAVLFSSHQLDLVQEVCEDVAIIDRGRVVLAGSLDEVRRRAPHRRLDLALEGGAEWFPTLAGIELLGKRPGWATYLVPAGTDPAALLADAARAGRVTRFSFQPPTLSDLFREAVGA
ncbi:MAG: ABC transporter ATP-binding protein [Actinobacteria bacterium]|nr:ABC transporter ATP-binding protein [Actinomycetota bacterium]